MARLIDADMMAAEETGAFISAQAQITDTATRLVNEVVHKKIQMLLADAPTAEIARPTVAAVPISELLALRDALYETDRITMSGLYDLNMLIAKYDGGKDNAT